MGSHCVQQESGIALTSPRGPFSHPWVTLSCRTYTREKTLNLCRIFPKLIFFPVMPLYRPNVLKTFLVGVYSFVSCSGFCDTCSMGGFMAHGRLFRRCRMHSFGSSWRPGLEARKRHLAFPCLGLPRCHHSQLHLPSQQNSIAIDPCHPLCRTPTASEEGCALCCSSLMMLLRSDPHFPSSGDFLLTEELKLLITKNTVMRCLLLFTWSLTFSFLSYGEAGTRGQVLVIGERVIEFATGADFQAYQNVPW